MDAVVPSTSRCLNSSRITTSSQVIWQTIDGFCLLEVSFSCLVPAFVGHIRHIVKCEYIYTEVDPCVDLSYSLNYTH